jgi:DNA-binding transcriptional MocR family regulator
LVKEHKPALFYTIPVYQNPTGVTSSQENRLAVIELAQKHGFLVVADEVYQLLNYSSVPPRPLGTYLESGVVLGVGSFSKILAPGLRLGWIQTSSALQQRILDCGLLKSGGGLNHFVGCLVGAALQHGWHAEFTERIRKEYAFRVDVMDRCLQKTMPDLIKYRKPDGGFFFWVELPPEMDAEKLLVEANRRNTGFRPGVRFSSRGELKNFTRLSFAHYNENAISVGIDRLAEAVREY